MVYFQSEKQKNIPLLDEINDLIKGSKECRKSADLKEKIEKWDWFIDHLKNIEKSTKKSLKEFWTTINTNQNITRRQKINIRRDLKEIFGKEFK